MLLQHQERIQVAKKKLKEAESQIDSLLHKKETLADNLTCKKGQALSSLAFEWNKSATLAQEKQSALAKVE